MIEFLIIGVIILFIYAFVMRVIFRINDILINLENQTRIIGDQKRELIKGINIQNKYLENIDKNISSLLEEKKSIEE